MLRCQDAALTAGRSSIAGMGRRLGALLPSALPRLRGAPCLGPPGPPWLRCAVPSVCASSRCCCSALLLCGVAVGRLALLLPFVPCRVAARSSSGLGVMAWWSHGAGAARLHGGACGSRLPLPC